MNRFSILSLILFSFLLGCSHSEQGQRKVASRESQERYRCEYDTLYEGSKKVAVYAGWIICDHNMKELNAGQKYRCDHEGTLFDGLEEIKSYAGWPICNQYMKELNEGVKFRCEYDGSLYDGIEKIRQYGSWEMCHYNLKEM